MEIIKSKIKAGEETQIDNRRYNQLMGYEEET